MKTDTTKVQNQYSKCATLPDVFTMEKFPVFFQKKSLARYGKKSLHLTEG